VITHSTNVLIPIPLNVNILKFKLPCHKSQLSQFKELEISNLQELASQSPDILPMLLSVEFLLIL